MVRIRYLIALQYHAPKLEPTATAESTKALTGLVKVNNANKIATRLVYDTLRVELVIEWVKLQFVYPFYGQSAW